MVRPTFFVLVLVLQSVLAQDFDDLFVEYEEINDKVIPSSTTTTTTSTTTTTTATKAPTMKSSTSMELNETGELTLTMNSFFILKDIVYERERRSVVVLVDWFAFLSTRQGLKSWGRFNLKVLFLLLKKLMWFVEGVLLYACWVFQRDRGWNLGKDVTWSYCFLASFLVSNGAVASVE